MAASARTRLSDALREMLGQKASVQLVKEVAPELMNQLTAGKSLPTIAELLVKKVVGMALDPKRQCQWAVELIFDRMEGKAVQGAAVREDARITEEKLDDLTAEHLNSIAAEFSKDAARELAGSDAEDAAHRPAADDLDLPDDGADGPEEAPGEPALEEIPAGPGGLE